MVHLPLDRRRTLTLRFHNGFGVQSVLLLRVFLTGIGYYANSATSVKIEGWMTGQFFPDLTMFLLRDFLQHEV
jgi:hypothetical protein